MVAPFFRRALSALTPAAASAALGANVLPAGTTANRPAGAAVGTLYYDTTISKVVVLKTAPSTWTDTAGTAA